MSEKTLTNIDKIIYELVDRDGGTTTLTANILRNWSRDKTRCVRCMLDDALFAAADAMGEMESQAVDLHKYNIAEAKRRNKIAQECLGKAINTLYTPGPCPKCAAVKERLRELTARDPYHIELREWMSLTDRHEYALREVAHWRFVAKELLAILEGAECAECGCAETIDNGEACARCGVDRPKEGGE